MHPMKTQEEQITELQARVADLERAVTKMTDILEHITIVFSKMTSTPYIN